jgi:hypothetical protein
MFPFYFVIGSVAPFAILVFFMLASDAGFHAKGFVLLTFIAILLVPAFLAEAQFAIVPTVCLPLLGMVARILFAVVLLVWIKAEGVGLA